MQELRQTKIICTIGPSSSSEEKIKELVQAGMNVARLNFSHGTHDEHAKVISTLKKVREEMKVPLAILLDTKGPEIRVGELKENLSLEPGQIITLVGGEAAQNEIEVHPPSVVDELVEGTELLFDDGYITSIVRKVTESRAEVEIQNSGILKSRKGINVPSQQFSFPQVTEKDIEDIRFGCRQRVDVIAASFVCGPEQVREIKEIIREEQQQIPLLAKIESRLGVDCFEEILEASDGIMIARGDLGVEMPLFRLPPLQKMMIRRCCQEAKPVVTATQMLESMIDHPRPTRAEVSDVANAIFDGTSCVMLSGETAAGKYPVETVKMMDSIILEAEREFDNYSFFLASFDEDRIDIPSAVALSAVKTAYSTEAKAIIVCSKAGTTARRISRYRPDKPVFVVTPNHGTYHQMSISWGTYPIIEKVSDLEKNFRHICAHLLSNKLLSYGDLTVITSGQPYGMSHTTNMIVVKSIGNVLVRGSPGEDMSPVKGEVLFLDQEPGADPRGKIVVLSRCSWHHLDAIQKAEGIILQNGTHDIHSVKYIKSLGVPYVCNAMGADTLLSASDEVTIYPSKGLVFAGDALAEEKSFS